MEALTGVLRRLDAVTLAILCATDFSTRDSTPLTSSHELTRSLLTDLQAVGAIELHETPIPNTVAMASEPFYWSYRSPCLPSDRLSSLLLQMLTTLDRASYSGLVRRLWVQLADAEAESYLTHQLRSHHMDPSDAKFIITALSEDWFSHSLGRRRYLTWFGLRGAASVLLRSNIDYSMARSSLVQEIQRRSRWLISAVSNEDYTAYCFVPDARWRRPLLLSVALSTILPIGNRYWTHHPASTPLD
jgi:hypothetical protein